MVEVDLVLPIVGVGRRLLQYDDDVSWATIWLILEPT